jgi:hypothetical protein
MVSDMPEPGVSETRDRALKRAWNALEDVYR